MSSSTVEKIKEKLDVVDVIGSYIKLEKAGSSLKARCPFHNEKSPSFFVSPARGTYYCFGCGAKGDIFSFVEQFEGVDFRGALKTLAERAGVPLERENLEAKSEKDRLYQVLEIATIYFERGLGDCVPARDYLKKRGIIKESVREWRIGYAENDWRNLYSYLLGKGVSVKDMLAVGLIKKSEKPARGEEYYDTFRGRIIFPIFDSSGRPVAFTGRILIDDGKSPKYLNSPETILFNKSETLYGLNKAKSEIRKKDYSVLVEGQMDLVMSHQVGVTNVVASSGTALTPYHLERLKKLSNRVIISFDSDEAGFKAANRAGAMALNMGLEVKCVGIVGGKDPADLVLEDPELWKKALKDAEHIVDFYLNRLISKNLSLRDLAKEIRTNVLPYVQTLESTIEKGHFVSKIAKLVSVKDDAVWEDLKKSPKIKVDGIENISNITNSPKVLAREKNALTDLAGIVLWQKTLPSPNIDVISLTARVESVVGAEKFNALLSVPDDIKSEMIFEAEMRYFEPEVLTKAMRELVIYTHIDWLVEEEGREMRNLEIAKEKKDNNLEVEILKKCQEIASKINSLKIELKNINN